MFTGNWWKVAFLDRWRVWFAILHDCKTSRSDIEWNFSFGSKALTCKFIAVPREYSQGVLAGKVDPSATKVVQNLELSNTRKASFLIKNTVHRSFQLVLTQLFVVRRTKFSTRLFI